MRRKLVIGLVLLNGLLAGALLATPAETQIIPRGIRKCCKTDGGLEPYCCYCCWFVTNCIENEDC